MAFVVVTTKQKLFFSFKRDQNENRFKKGKGVNLRYQFCK